MSQNVMAVVVLELLITTLSKKVRELSTYINNFKMRLAKKFFTSLIVFDLFLIP